MTLEEYVARFRLLQHGAEKDERSLALLSSGAYHDFLHRFEKTSDPILSSVMISEEKLRKSLEKKQRLCERYAARLARAAARIKVRELREYALYHFLYGLTHEEIAHQSFFCVRTVYRYAKRARKELESAMLSVQPRLVRTAPHRYRVPGGVVPRKEVDLDRITRSVAFCTALHRRDISLAPKRVRFSLNGPIDERVTPKNKKRTA